MKKPQPSGTKSRKDKNRALGFLHSENGGISTNKIVKAKG
jgi:hypothetical protein